MTAANPSTTAAPSLCVMTQACGEAQPVGGMSDLVPTLTVVDDRQHDHSSHNVGSAAVVLAILGLLAILGR